MTRGGLEPTAGGRTQARLRGVPRCRDCITAELVMIGVIYYRSTCGTYFSADLQPKKDIGEYVQVKTGIKIKMSEETKTNPSVRST